MKSRFLLALFVIVGLLTPVVQAEESKIESLKITSGPFRIQVEVEGVFVADEMTEVSIEPEEWSSFEVVEAVPHGRVVRKGDLLVKFDAKDLNEAIEEKEASLRESEVSVLQAERDLPLFEKTITLNFEEAEQNFRHAQEDFERFLKIDRPMAERSADHSLESSKNQLMYEMEELKQLEKMYKADDLTEETEEIVLIRQRNSVKSTRFWLERTKISREETLTVDLPRREKSMKDAVVQARLAFEKAKINLELKVKEKRLALERAKRSIEKEKEELEKLLADRKFLEVHAPADGVVYYGSCDDGKWGEIQSFMSSLKPKGTVSPETVFMTIVNPRNLKIVGKVAEGDLAGFSSGLSARLKPKANPDVVLQALVSSMSSIPVGDGLFNVELRLKSRDTPEWIVPGMNCTATVTTYEKKSAITIPSSALHTDEMNPEVQYVYLLDKEGKHPNRHLVKKGKTSGDKVEILDGLSNGDSIATGDVDENAEEKEAAEEHAEEAAQETAAK